MSDIKQELYRISDDFASHMRLLDILKSEGEDTGPLEKTIAEYFTHEVTRDKIDSVIGYIRYCEEMRRLALLESDRLKSLAESYETQAAWLKDTVKGVLEMSGQKRLEGLTAGSLTLRANGGKQAVTITDASLVPEEYVQYEGRISGAALKWLRLKFGPLEKYSDFDVFWGRQDVQMERIPHKGRIGEALSKPCDDCNGYGTKGGERGDPVCDSCGGDGKARVPGARLEPRGNFVAVK